MGTSTKFQLGDVVRKEGAAGEDYQIIALRQFEPCCQIQSIGRPSLKEWAISQDLELVSPRGEAKGTAAGT